VLWFSGTEDNNRVIFAKLREQFCGSGNKPARDETQESIKLQMGLQTRDN